MIERYWLNFKIDGVSGFTRGRGRKIAPSASYKPTNGSQDISCGSKAIRSRSISFIGPLSSHQAYDSTRALDL